MTFHLLFLSYKYDPENKIICGVKCESYLNSTQIESIIRFYCKGIAPFRIAKFGEIKEGYCDPNFLDLYIDCDEDKLFLNTPIITNDELMKYEKNNTGSINFN